VSVPTAEIAAPESARPPAAAFSVDGRLPGGRFYIALAAFALIIAALSLLIPSTPSYDPWAWLVWGREIVHLDLHTTGGPSWKPLPVMFTTAFALFGKAAPDMWLLIARAGALVAVAMVFKLAWRIARPLATELIGAPGRLGSETSATAQAASLAVVPALLAAAIAAASLVNSPGFVTDNALGYSEGLMTALVLVALDRHLDGARRQAFAVGFFAALDRPELWLLWGPYGLYLWFQDPGARRLVLGLFALIPVLWFLPELWGSGHLLRGVTRAQHPRSNSAAFASCPFCTEFAKHAWPRVMLRVKVVGLVAMAVAALGLWVSRGSWWRRTPVGPGTRARLMLLVAGAIGWLWWVGISVETQAGFSGNDRYLVLGSALIAISGAVGWGWGTAALAAFAQRLRGARALASRSPLLAGSGAAVVAVAVLIATPPWIGPSILDVPATHRALVYQAHLRHDLARAVKELGARRILSCGTIMTEGFQVPMLAWNLGVHTARIEASPSKPGGGTPPNVIFQTRAQRNATLLPIIRPWNVHYTEVARVRTFRVFANCANAVAL
jgi:hypothetical protein